MEEQRTIIVTDDEQSLREFIRLPLEDDGYRVVQAANGMECLALVQSESPDLVILDVVMPEMDGLETCRTIRTFSQVPVLMLTAKMQSEDVVTGLNYGADDYLIKPFNLNELMARIRALLRRVPSAYQPLIAGDGTLQIDQQKREVIVRENPVDLTPTEYQLLVLLAKQAGRVVEHRELLEGVWGIDCKKDNEHLKVYIWHLRRKIEQDPQKPALLLTEWGIGYRLVGG
jgi:two-component system KDP operon response regulator KdpE